MKYLKYIAAYFVPAIVAMSLYLKGWWSFSAIIVLYGLVPLIELFLNGSEKNMTQIEEEIANHDPIYDYLLYGLVPVQYALLAYFLIEIGNADLMTYEVIGMLSSMGLACGIAINNAHELGHRNTRHEQFMSKALLLTTLYMHFFIEHNRGHHMNVATEGDPASSRSGENVYSFFIRTVKDSWLSAWDLERKRLQQLGKSQWTWDNEMLRFQLIQLALLVSIGFTFGLSVLGYFVLSSVMGFLLLETVNYIEHYGLQRKKNGKRYERTLPIHSWNSNHPLGRLILLELSRHSDHHFQSNRKYQVLRHFDESPQMPTGYPGMMLMALVPPLWFHVMDERVDKYKNSQLGTALA